MKKKYAKSCAIFLGISLIVLSCTGCAEWRKKWESETGKIYEDQISLNKEQIHKIGEEVHLFSPTEEDAENVAMNYVIKSATLYQNPSEAGIEEKKILYPIEYYSNLLEEGESITPEDVQNHPMLILEMEITNISEDDPTIGRFSLIKDVKGEILQLTYPCYYSLGEDTAESEYYHYKLEKGQKTELKMGYYIMPEEQLEDIMLTDNYGGDEKITNYVDLDL